MKKNKLLKPILLSTIPFVATPIFFSCQQKAQDTRDVKYTVDAKSTSVTLNFSGNVFTKFDFKDKEVKFEYKKEADTDFKEQPFSTLAGNLESGSVKLSNLEVNTKYVFKLSARDKAKDGQTASEFKQLSIVSSKDNLGDFSTTVSPDISEAKVSLVDARKATAFQAEITFAQPEKFKDKFFKFEIAEQLKPADSQVLARQKKLPAVSVQYTDTTKPLVVMFNENIKGQTAYNVLSIMFGDTKETATQTITFEDSDLLNTIQTEPRISALRRVASVEKDGVKYLTLSADVTSIDKDGVYELAIQELNRYKNKPILQARFDARKALDDLSEQTAEREILREEIRKNNDWLKVNEIVERVNKLVRNEVYNKNKTVIDGLLENITDAALKAEYTKQLNDTVSVSVLVELWELLETRKSVSELINAISEDQKAKKDEFTASLNAVKTKEELMALETKVKEFNASNATKPSTETETTTDTSSQGNGGEQVQPAAASTDPAQGSDASAQTNPVAPADQPKAKTTFVDVKPATGPEDYVKPIVAKVTATEENMTSLTFTFEGEGTKVKGRQYILAIDKPFVKVETKDGADSKVELTVKPSLKDQTIEDVNEK
ncbi:hypothetical protein [Mycoplasma procyoni]|uniref:hypothetical protein n=1 Tax=Mycoplasma procyoni TaxID=568784 RepID=UPI00197B60A8|nr:hypothetical protein [Mycoplasma procyoni]MBN3535018.1 hypothetical protein [Mycoplasma procyoni]